MDKESLKAIRNLLREELAPIKSQLDENTKIVNQLVHNSKVNRAEHDSMINTLARIEGSPTAIENNVNEMKENDKSMYEMLGEHEIAIRSLKRRPV